MKLNAIGITSSDFVKTIKFYEILGFIFSVPPENGDHIESIAEKETARLMIDKKESIEQFIGEKPKPSNHSTFAVEYDSPSEIDKVCSDENGRDSK